MIIVSACLAGMHCRHDAAEKTCEAVARLVAEGKALPVCPEQMGGMPTPRPPSEIRGGRVFTRDGADVSEAFQRGAQDALRLAKLAGATRAILKAKSPSCGSGQVYDGTFSARLVPGDGIFARLCRENGIAVQSEEEI